MAGVLGDPICSKINLSPANDLNNINKNGIYSFYIEKGIPINMPSELDRGLLFVFGNGVHIVQLVFGISKIMFRLGRNDIWYSWIDIS